MTRIYCIFAASKSYKKAAGQIAANIGDFNFTCPLMKVEKQSFTPRLPPPFVPVLRRDNFSSVQ
jgi:hypothetical protein